MHMHMPKDRKNEILGVFGKSLKNLNAPQVAVGWSDKGPFKYYVSMFLAFLGPPTSA